MKTLRFPITKSIAVAAALFSGLLAPSASAVPVAINFSATLGWGGLGSLAYGSALNGSITFDDAQLPTGNWGGTDIGVYYDNFASSATIGGQTVANPISFAQIANDSSVFFGDFVGLLVNFPPSGGYYSLGGLNNVATQFVFQNQGNSIISNESLTSVAGLVPANAGQAVIYFYDGNYAPDQAVYLGYAEITSWQASNVPDEGLTVLLLGMSAAGLLALRRAYRRN